MMKKKVDPGTARNTEEPQGIPHLQLCIREVFMTGMMSEWAMSTIEDNLATPEGPKISSSMERIHKAWARGEKSKCD